MPDPKLLAILPCFNEADNIVQLLDSFKEVDLPMDILVIDDGSTDDTFAKSSPKSLCIRHPINLGIGATVQTGIRYAHRQGYDFCVQIDGDGQHLPSEIPKLLEAQQSSGADVVIGSRYIKNLGYQSTPLRRLGGKIISYFTWLLFPGLRIKDPTSGFRLINSRAMRYLEQNYPTDYPEPISNVWMHRKGLRIIETPAVMKERQGGRSSIRKLKALIYMIRVILYISLARIQIKS